MEPLTAYASALAFEEMVRAAQHVARQGFRRPRAVLATGPRDRFEARLIGIDGKPLARPELLPMIGNPASDRHLSQLLRARLANARA